MKIAMEKKYNNPKDKKKYLLYKQYMAIKEGNAKNAFLLAQIDEDYIDVNALQQVVINSKDSEAIFQLAVRCARANVKQIEDAMIKFGDNNYLLNLGLFVEGVNCNRILKELARRNDPNKMKSLIKAKSDFVDCKFAQDYFVQVGATREILYLLLDAPDKVDFDYLQDFLIKNKAAFECFTLAVKSDWADKSKLEKALIEWGNANWCFHLLENEKAINKEDIIQSLMLKHDVVYAAKAIPFAEGVQRLQLIYFVANSVNIDICQKVIEKTDLTMKELDILEKAIEETKRKYYPEMLEENAESEKMLADFQF